MRRLGLFLLLVVIASSTAIGAEKVVNQDYILALSGANRFLCAWQWRDQDAGLKLLSPTLRKKHSEYDLRMWISGVSNPHHQAFEIQSGRRLSVGRYLFPVRLYLHQTDQLEKQIVPRMSRIVMVKDGLEQWLVDELPADPSYKLVSATTRSGAITIFVDGKVLNTLPQPVLRRGRVFIPVTAFKRIGLAVKVISKDEAWVGWPSSEFNYAFKAGRKTSSFHDPDSSTTALPGTPFMRRGALMVPLRSMFPNIRLSDLTAEWNSRSKAVHIHRSAKWRRWRLQHDVEFRKSNPDWYSTPI